MRTALKWLAIILGGLLGLLLVVVLFVTLSSSSRINRTYEIPPPNISVDNDDETLARGRHLVEISCADCHGADLAGRNLNKGV